MKNLIFAIYAFFYNLRAMFPARRNTVGLVSMHNADFKDGLGQVEKELLKRNKDFKVLHISRKALNSPLTALKFCTVDAFRLGSAKYIFLNDNFMPLSKLKVRNDTKIVQLWHGQGAFKKFGLAIDQPEEIRKCEALANSKLTHVVSSSVGVKEIYAEAFGIDLQKVITTGTPNEDYYFESHDLKSLRADFISQYPKCRGKKLVLYAPTFRETKAENEALLTHFDTLRLGNDLQKSLSSEVEILVRLHPQVHANIDVSKVLKDVVDVTDYSNVNELCLLSDILITDYSSICMDFSLLNKPMLFYAYDLDSYKDSRNFYFDYETYVPGTVARDMDELCTAAENLSLGTTEEMRAFRRFNFDEPCGNATEKLLDVIL